VIPQESLRPAERADRIADLWVDRCLSVRRRIHTVDIESPRAREANRAALQRYIDKLDEELKALGAKL